jgi:hypothetical protein
MGERRWPANDGPRARSNTHRRLCTVDRPEGTADGARVSSSGADRLGYQATVPLSHCIGVCSISRLLGGASSAAAAEPAARPNGGLLGRVIRRICLRSADLAICWELGSETEWQPLRRGDPADVREKRGSGQLRGAREREGVAASREG